MHQAVTKASIDADQLCRHMASQSYNEFYDYVIPQGGINMTLSTHPFRK